MPFAPLTAQGSQSFLDKPHFLHVLKEDGSWRKGRLCGRHADLDKVMVVGQGVIEELPGG